MINLLYTEQSNTEIIPQAELKYELIEEILKDLMNHISMKQYDIIKKTLISHFKPLELIEQNISFDNILENENNTLINLFFKAKQVEGLSPKTLHVYNKSIESFLKFLDNKPISHITTEDVRDFLTNMMANNSSAVTANNHRRNLNSFFGWLSVEEHIIRNPVARISKIKEKGKLKKAFSGTEIEALRAESKIKCKSKINNLRNTAILELLLCSGIRISELEGLDINSIDFQNNKFIVLGKGNKERTCYLNSSAKFALQAYLNERTDDEIPLFVSSRRPFRRLTVSAIERCMRDIGNNVNVKNTHPHRFRRTFATNAVKRGIPLEKLQLLMGHTNTNTTMIYVDLNVKDGEYAYDKYVR